jgi:hypothetical protein
MWTKMGASFTKRLVIMSHRIMFFEVIKYSIYIERFYDDSPNEKTPNEKPPNEKMPKTEIKK